MPRTRYVAGKLLTSIVSPPLVSTTFEARGFPGRTAPARARLEAIPRTVVCGFEWSLEDTTLVDLASRLEVVREDLRGFAFEGAAMGLALKDATMPVRQGPRRVTELLAGPARDHVLLSMIGVGFAMNHVPRRLWSRMTPDLSGHPYFPAADWLAVDGYGFDLAYFRTPVFVDQQVRPRPYAFRADPAYFLRAVDQGIGRALWFICGARPSHVAAAVGRFAPDRRSDLWSGVGLAATYAGPADPDDLRALVRGAGHHVDHVRQGAAFAARARVDSGHLPESSDCAATVLSGGKDAAELAAVVARCVAVPRDVGPGDWDSLRTRVRHQLQ